MYFPDLVSFALALNEIRISINTLLESTTLKCKRSLKCLNYIIMMLIIVFYTAMKRSSSNSEW